MRIAGKRPRTATLIAFSSSFVFTVVLGAALSARATVPCNAHETMELELTTHRIDGVVTTETPTRTIDIVESSYGSDGYLVVHKSDPTLENDLVQITVRQEAP